MLFPAGASRLSRLAHDQHPGMDPIDTQAEARMGDDLVIAALRGWSMERRSMAQARLTALVRSSSRQAWRDRHPDLPTLAADIAWAEHQYGPEIGAALRRWSAGRA